MANGPIEDYQDKITSQMSFNKLKEKELEFQQKALEMEVEQRNIEKEILKMKDAAMHQDYYKDLEKQLVSLKANQRIYEQISEDYARGKKNLEQGLGTFKEMRNIIPRMSDALKNFDLTKFIRNPLAASADLLQDSFGKIGLRGTALLLMMKQVTTQLLKWDKSLTNFRQSMGFLRGEFWTIQNTIRQMSAEMAHLGATSDDIVESFKELSNLQGGIWNVSKNLVKLTTAMAASLGVAQSTSAGALRNFAVLSHSTMETSQNTLLWSKSLANAAGVSFSAIASDLGSMSESTLVMASRLPTTLAKSAVELRRMGTSLADAAQASREILNFTENVQDEMEASVLLGQSINLQKARQLAYQRDLEGSTKEILRIAKQIDFASLDPFQMEAFAKATGRSVDELFNMVQADKEISVALKSQDESVRNMAREYDKLRNANEAMRKAEAENTKNKLMQLSNQERLTAIQDKWNQLIQKGSYLLFPIIDGLLSLAIPVMDIATGIMAWSKALTPFMGVLETAFEWFGKIFTTATEIFPWFGKIVGVVGKVAGWFGEIFGWIGKVFPFASKLFGVFGKFLGPIGWIITAFQFFFNLFRRLHGIGDAFKEGILNGIWFGIKAIGGALYDTLLKPFVDAWEWIKGIFVGKSPSTLALGIVKGVVAIQSMLFDAITYPWRHAAAWIADKFGFGGLANKLRGGAGGLVASVENKVASPTPATITPTAQASPTQQSKQVAAAEKTQEALNLMTNETGQMIVKKIDELITAMKNGGIGINMDGQLLSATLARQTEFRGGFGVNKV